ncbi:ornithine carbamoyltransferase [Desulfonispora thiosulfatigenes DSM 11270]|uniref:Ornithine carbamoyltransferase n=1 Tax=Desulfonispora thiosulfatigenes DSM 11270 TaxID=656914 RepID=A0A1W1VDW4_DESTI|nr:ornithine carbamoyltransferase [Desulfonispora thiosulfatigenes]SMB91134.1 ornithine carbamoyltransferase [Desulfonispora thiosulfatigenes DSM 11270]
MNIDLKGRDYLTLKDYSPDEIKYLIDLSLNIKQKEKNGERDYPLQGKSLAMIFQKSSTRTRVSFEVGMYQLGGNALFLSPKELQMGRGETIGDTAQVLSRFVDGIMIRTFDQAEVEELATYASVPVINGLTDSYHPTQALADMMTILEHKGKLEGIKLAYIGDGNNMTNSLMIVGAKLGMEVRVATPVGYEPETEVVNYAKCIAEEQGGNIIITNDPKEAVRGADALYTDTWISMGQENDREEKINHFKGFQLNKELVELASKEAIILHCLPAHRGEEITDEIMDGPRSVVFDEAENRLHAHKGILAALL